MSGLLGKKIGMTSIYTEDGQIIPVTVLETGPCEVVAVKTNKKDGYEALLLGFGERKEKHVNKPQMEYYKKNKITPARNTKEFRNFDISEYKIGDKLTVDIFAVGDKVRIVGTSKGKGFQGVMRRHNFSGVGGRTHGQGDRERAPGSIGQSSWPSRVFKGTKMGGRMGGDRVTISSGKVVQIIPEKNLLLVKGPVPGCINSIVEINK